MARRVTEPVKIPKGKLGRFYKMIFEHYETVVPLCVVDKRLWMKPEYIEKVQRELNIDASTNVHRMVRRLEMLGLIHVVRDGRGSGPIVTLTRI